MKKYKSVNFLEENIKEKKNNKLYKIVLTLFLMYLIINTYYEFKEMQKLESYIKENTKKNLDIDVLEVMSYDEPYVMNINNIQEIYNSVGKNNIISLVANRSNIEVEGRCLDINILDNIKNYEFIKSMSVNKIKKEGDAYIFNVSYEIIGK